jgi:glycosyltransferase involved in cell wall biosynthesis
VLYGAIGGDRDDRKGADLLHSALERLTPLEGRNVGAPPLEVLAFGGKVGVRQIGAHAVRSVGHLDDASLRSYYSAADVMVVPSRIDNLPQTAVEAVVCGTPVVAFRTGGLPDIVDDGINGRLAEPFDPESLAEAITWVLVDPDRHQRVSQAARSSASRWSPKRIAGLYGELFEEMLVD